MKKSLLATAAAAALIASSGFALAQGAGNEQAAPKAGASEMHNSGPGMKMRDGDMGSGARTKKDVGTTGQGSNMETGTKSGTNAEAKPEQPETRAHGKSGHRRSEMKSENRSNAAEHRTDERSNMKAQGEEHRGSKAAHERRGSSTTTGQGAAASAPVQLTTEQKTNVRKTVIDAKSAPRVERNNINFNIGVGTVVPRTIHIVTVPETLIRIHPAWRGYRYFVVGEEVVIVEPDTMRIVAVLEV
jgi:hypothetical protein